MDSVCHKTFLYARSRSSKENAISRGNNGIFHISTTDVSKYRKVPSSLLPEVVPQLMRPIQQSLSSLRALASHVWQGDPAHWMMASRNDRQMVPKLLANVSGTGAPEVRIRLTPATGAPYTPSCIPDLTNPTQSLHAMIGDLLEPCACKVGTSSPYSGSLDKSTRATGSTSPYHPLHLVMLNV